MNLRYLLLLLTLFAGAQIPAFAAVSNTQQDFYPLRIHPNGKHITDNNGKPFLMVADVAWQLLRKLGYEDAIQYMDQRKSQSFNTFLIQLLPSLPNQRNFYRTAPLSNNRLSEPVKPYFDYVERIVAAANARNLVVGIVVSRKSWNVVFDTHKDSDWEAWGAYLSKRFEKYPNIIWIVSEEEYQSSAQYKFIAEGLRGTEGQNLIASLSTCSPTRPIDGSSNKSDLKFVIPDSTVTYSEYANLANWQKNSGELSVQPFLISNSEFPKEITDQSVLIRSQAYQSVMSSAAGFCHMSTIKNFNPTWKVNITRDGAEYIDHFVKILKGIPWEYMYPDNSPDLLPDSTDKEQIGIFSLSNQRLAMLYVPESKPVQLDLNALKGNTFRAVWYSPRTGRRWSGASSIPKSTTSVSPPDPKAGWDWILLIGAQD
jgi:hypothetical protein